MQQTLQIGDYRLSFADRMRLRAFVIAYGEFREAQGQAAARRILPDMAQRYGAVRVERGDGVCSGRPTGSEVGAGRGLAIQPIRLDILR